MGKDGNNNLDIEYWLSHNRTSSTSLVGTNEVVVKADAIKRQMEDERWSP